MVLKGKMIVQPETLNYVRDIVQKVKLIGWNLFLVGEDGDKAFLWTEGLDSSPEAFQEISECLGISQEELASYEVVLLYHNYCTE